MKKGIVILAICLCALVVVGFATVSSGMQRQSAAAAAAKGKPAPAPTSIQFWDRGTDQITSDGQGPYVNGGNIRCEVQANQILLNVTRGKRGIHCDYRNMLTTCCDEGINVPTGTVNGGGVVVITWAPWVPVGETRACIAQFWTSVGVFRFRANPFAGQGTDARLCSYGVVVSRLTPQTWYVTTDPHDYNKLDAQGNPAPIPLYPYSAFTASPFDCDTTSTLPGLYNMSSTGPWFVPVGNHAQMGDLNDFKGNYRMSFGLTVTCPSCK